MLRQILSRPPKLVKFYSSMAKKSAVVLVAPGSEEMEFTISVDVLRRAGVEVTVAGVGCSGTAKLSRDVVVQPDMPLAEAVKKGPFDAVVLPGGGGGSQTFCELAEVGELLKDQEKRGGLIAAICAAPLALKAHGIGLGKKLTCYPSCKDDLVKDYDFTEQKVVFDGNLLTSQGPGTAFDFALSIAKEMVGEEKAKQVQSDLLL